MIVDKRQSAPVVKVEEPPPYTRADGPSSSLSRVNDAQPAHPSSLPTPYQVGFPSTFAGQTTNSLGIKTRKDPITGYFLIDPSLSLGVPLADGKEKRKTRRNRKFKMPWQAILPDEESPNATLATRQGDVRVSISAVSTTADPSPRRAIVDVSTRQGDCDVCVVQIDNNRSLNLRVTTRSGNIFVLLPRTFSGPVHLHTKRGNIVFLATLSRNMRMVTMREDEALVMLGTGQLPDNQPSQATPWVGDYMSLTSKRGNLTIGFIGEDRRPEEGGIWKKMADFFFK